MNKRLPADSIDDVEVNAAPEKASINHCLIGQKLKDLLIPEKAGSLIYREPVLLV